MLKLVSLNTEAHKHLDKIIPFLQREQPDVVCLQEVLQSDVATYQEALGMQGQFVPLMKIAAIPEHEYLFGNTTDDVWGVLQLSRLPTKEAGEMYYYGQKEQLQLYDLTQETVLRALAWSRFVGDGQEFTVGTLHFVVSSKGQTSQLQVEQYESLARALDHFPEMILCGDFNAPRGREIFNRFVQRYTDNIPAQYVTSIDGNLHRDGKIELMVDGLFTTPHYRTEDVRLVDGVSDHMAVVAKVFRT